MKTIGSSSGAGFSLNFYKPRGGGNLVGFQFDHDKSMGWCLSAGVRNLFAVALLRVRDGA